jgi:hypothetical protein
MQILLALILCVLFLGLTIKLVCMLFRLAFRLFLWFVKAAFVVICILSLVYVTALLLPGL